MPIVFKIRNVVLFFYSKEHLPVHVHVRAAEKRAKFDVVTGELLVNNGFSKKDINLLQKLVKSEQKFILEAWHEYFKSKK